MSARGWVFAAALVVAGSAQAQTDPSSFAYLSGTWPGDSAPAQCDGFLDERATDAFDYLVCVPLSVPQTAVLPGVPVGPISAPPAVPEPSMWLLMGLGLVALLGRRRK